MKTPIAVAGGLARLFVEDGALAIAILAIVVAAGICAALIQKNAAPASGAILLVGCLGVLFLNVMQSRRR
jgi:hypothetical protein